MKNIEFLALEGGGGKGTAYLTLAKILEENSQIENIKGFSGASAGAITSFLMSIGVSYSEMYEYIFDEKVFEKFIPHEEAIGSKRPSFRCVIQRDEGVSGGKMFLPASLERSYWELFKDVKFYFNLPKNVDTVISLLIPGSIVTKSFNKYFGPVDNYVQSKKEELLGEFSDLISPSTVTNLLGLGGLFSGDSVISTLDLMLFKALPQIDKEYIIMGKQNVKYRYFEEKNNFVLIAEEMNQDTSINYGKYQDTVPYLDEYNKYDNIPSPSEIEMKSKVFEGQLKSFTEGEILLNYSGHWNFERLYNVFGKDLYITASNLVDGETYIFSRETTPDFPVVYAVAISMNLPLWTPIFVSYINKHGVDYTGWYFDGGLYNNFPIRLFSDNLSAKSKSKPQNELMGLPLRDDTFGFYVGEKSTYLKQFPNLKAVGGAISDSLMDKSTFGKYYKSENSRILALKTEGLSTYNFTPDKFVFDSLEKENEKLIKNFLLDVQ